MVTTPMHQPKPTDRSLLRERGDEWCRLEVQLSRQGTLRLSICGTQGRIVTRAVAKKEALLYWTSFFEENLDELTNMANRFNKRFSTVTQAAKFVLETDGDFHGLDVDHEEDDRIFISESCGQIRDDLAEWFPECVPYLKWHLNDMHAECEHQEARGETYTTHPTAVCSDCGYKMGSEWTSRKLPKDVIDWVYSLPR